MKEYMNSFFRTAGRLADQVKVRAEGIRGRLAAAQKPPEAKDIMLQTYFTSLLSLVLCVGMFLGTSYAWFTSEVTNTSNEIYIGILDVELEKVDKQTPDRWLSLSETNADGNIHQLFDSGIFWEPGDTALETIRVTNTGDLAFKYVLNFTDGTVTAENIEAEKLQSLEAVAQYFDVWFYDHAQTTGNAAADSYAAITAPESGWTNAGTLDKILAGKTVLEGEMDLPAAQANNGDTGRTYTIALHMNDDADASVMGHKIILSVKLMAYQKTGETDTGITAVTELETLKDKLAAANANILLAANVEIDDAEDRLTMNGGVLDGYNKTISYTAEKGANDPSLGVVTVSGGTVRNLTIEGGDAGRALYSEKLTADLLVSNCVLDGAYAFNLSSAEATELTMRFVKTTFKSWTSYANVMKSAAFADCTFEDVLRPYGDTTLTGCTFTTAGLDVSKLEDGETVTLENCTYNGVAIEKAVVTAEGVECEGDLITVSAEGKVILSSNG